MFVEMPSEIVARLMTRVVKGSLNRLVIASGKAEGSEGATRGTCGKLSFGYEIINAASRTRRTLRVTTLAVSFATLVSSC